MELTRRDAMLALAAGSAVVGGLGEVADRITAAEFTGEFDDRTIGQIVAVAEVVYPSEVTPTEEFVSTYTLGRTSNRREYRVGIQHAVADLERESQERYGSRVHELSLETRDRLLRSLGVGNVVPDPDGTVAERVRYYLVNELLLALYTSPVGGRLLGHENPTGYPGGLAAYQRGPE